jgi:hypothetical protein
VLIFAETPIQPLQAHFHTVWGSSNVSIAPPVGHVWILIIDSLKIMENKQHYFNLICHFKEYFPILPDPIDTPGLCSLKLFRLTFFSTHTTLMAGATKLCKLQLLMLAICDFFQMPRLFGA